MFLLPILWWFRYSRYKRMLKDLTNGFTVSNNDAYRFTVFCCIMMPVFTHILLSYLIGIYRAIVRLSRYQCTGGVSLTFRELSQNILSKFVYCRNRTCYEDFKLKLCTCVQSHAFGARTLFSAWNYLHIYDFWQWIYLRDYIRVLHCYGRIIYVNPSRIMIQPQQVKCTYLMNILLIKC